MRKEDIINFRKIIDIKNLIKINIEKTFQDLWSLEIQQKTYLSSSNYEIWLTPKELEILIDLLKEVEKYVKETK